MDVVLQSFLAGFPVLLMHFLVTIVMLVVGVTIYVWITPHKDVALVREGNVAAAISLSGAILGLAIPLAMSMSVSVNVADIVIWGLLTLVIQLIVFRLADLLLRDLSARIEAGEVAAALLLSAIKLAVAAITAAAVSG
jgi:putative membrane protein